MSATQTYSITIQDIENYLDDKDDDEVIGITCDGMKCLVAEAFRMKYPDALVMVSATALSVWPDKAIKWEDVTIDADISTIVAEFDYLHPDHERRITKREWLTRDEVAL